jgi:hypothetical protein
MLNIEPETVTVQSVPNYSKASAARKIEPANSVSLGYAVGIQKIQNPHPKSAFWLKEPSVPMTIYSTPTPTLKGTNLNLF